MAYELEDAVSRERIENAVCQTLRLRTDHCGIPLGLLARIAVDETFCLCVTGVTDAIEHHLSTMHAALVTEVLRRAEKRLVDVPQAGTFGYTKPS
jgi:hypothetical protein